MKVYYAHPVSIYNTPQESRDMSLLCSLGWTVENPNQPKHQIGYKERGMDYFTEVIADCQILAFRALPSGEIPAGIKKEIDIAISLNFLVIELPSAMLRRSLSVDETREYLRESGAR